MVSDRSNPSPTKEIQEIDALLQKAGLVRNVRGKAVGVTRRVRQGRVTTEELVTAAPVPVVDRNGVPLLKIRAWDRPGRQGIPWLWHGFSTRMGGVSRAYCPDDAPGELNLGFTAADSREAVVQNRALFAEAITGSPATPLIAVRQIHSCLAHGTTQADASRETPWRGDAQITAEPGLLIAIQTADCIPVLVADRRLRVVAAFHAGWRGTVKRIVESGIGRMRLQFGSRPQDLVAGIGPGIGPCCYAVGEEVLSEFESQFAYGRELFHEVYSTDEVRNKYPMLFLTQRAPGHSPIGPALHLDLIEANRRQLLAAGLKPRAIQVVGGCTNCHPGLFFSHRASKGHAGRMMATIGIKP